MVKLSDLCKQFLFDLNFGIAYLSTRNCWAIAYFEFMKDGSGYFEANKFRVNRQAFTEGRLGKRNLEQGDIMG